MAHRHIRRRPFRDQPVARQHVAALEAAADAEAAWLEVLDPARAGRAEELVGAADVALDRRPGYREEVRRWSGAPADAREGVPARVAGPAAAPEERPTV